MSYEIAELKKIYSKLSARVPASELGNLSAMYKDKIVELSNDMPPADIAELLLSRDVSKQARFFHLLPRERAAQVFSYFDVHEQNNLLTVLQPQQIKELLSELDPDDRAELFEELPGVVTRKLLNLLDKESAKEVKQLLGYPEDSVGRLMTPDYVAVRPEWTISQALSHVRKLGSKSETSDVVYVTDKDWKLVGVVSLRNLILNQPKATVESIMKQPAISVQASADQEGATEVMQKYDITVLPVVDSSGTMVGIVTADDIFDVVREETAEDFQRSSAIGIFKESFLHSNILFLFQKRVGWLVMLAFINLIAGAIILSFEAMLAQTVVLVSFLPLLIGSAGNSGSQAATLTIRAMAVGDVERGDWLRVIGREVAIAFLLGIVMGVVAWGIGIFRADVVVALIVGSTMVILVLVGSLVGASLPFILQKLKLDPATASSPLVASIADVVGVLIYLLIAKTILSLG